MLGLIPETSMLSSIWTGPSYKSKRPDQTALAQSGQQQNLTWVSGGLTGTCGPPADQLIQRRVQPTCDRKASSEICAQVYFTQSVLRMKAMIIDGANPLRQHALSGSVCVGYYSNLANIQNAKTHWVFGLFFEASALYQNSSKKC